MRYALYYTPAPQSALAAFGEAWFARGAPHLDTPRRYGFHGTLKAPFRLAPETNEADLLAAAERFAAARPALAGPPLRLPCWPDFWPWCPPDRLRTLIVWPPIA